MNYFLIYKTTNILNGSYYIGKHTTSNLNDSYYGSGLKLRLSIKKYGIENFKREILEFCSETDLSEREAFYVDEDRLKDPLCMNLKIGGDGGDTRTYNPNREFLREQRKGWFSRMTIEAQKSYKEKMSVSVKRSINPVVHSNASKQSAIIRKMKHESWHSEETKLKISQNNKSGSTVVREKISASLSGRIRPDISSALLERYSDKRNHPRTKMFKLIHPNLDEELLVGRVELKIRCKELNLPLKTIVKLLNSGNKFNNYELIQLNKVML